MLSIDSTIYEIAQVHKKMNIQKLAPKVGVQEQQLRNVFSYLGFEYVYKARRWSCIYTKPKKELERPLWSVIKEMREDEESLEFTEDEFKVLKKLAQQHTVEDANRNIRNESTMILEAQQIDNELEGPIALDIESELEDGFVIEGSVRYYYSKHYERSLENRMLAIKKHGVNCVACSFNFEEVYGKRGKDFIEIHHVKPLSSLNKAVEVNPETDLVPLCANCHRMIHRRRDDVMSIEKLIDLLEKNKK